MSHSITKRHPKVEHICKQCGGAFFTTVSCIKSGGGIYCSRKCADLAKRNRIEHTCSFCRKKFIVRPSETSSKYCSRECYEQSRSRKVECICQQCGVSFYVYPADIDRGHGKCCSKKCMGIDKSGDKHPRWRGGHSNYRGKNWSRQRKLAYERDNGTCQYCGKKPKNNEQQCSVHHIKRFADFNGDWLTANQLTNLITLCSSCHGKAECGKIAIQPYLLSL